jgi:hypothetical protein
MPAPSGLTPNRKLPYPIADDSVNVPRDLQALATKLDGLVPTGLTLPTPPYVNGQQFVLRNGSAGEPWLMQYDSGIGGAAKWVFMGGPDYAWQAGLPVFRLNQNAPDNQSVYDVGRTYGDNAPFDLQMSIVVPGWYDVTHGAQSCHGDQNNQAFVASIAPPGSPRTAAALDQYGAFMGWTNYLAGSNHAYERTVRVHCGVGILAVVHRCTYGIAHFQERIMRVRPAMLGA